METRGHFLMPIWLRKCLRRVLTPTPHVTEHSLHAPHSDVSHTPPPAAPSAGNCDSEESASLASSPLRYEPRIVFWKGHNFSLIFTDYKRLATYHHFVDPSRFIN